MKNIFTKESNTNPTKQIRLLVWYTMQQESNVPPNQIYVDYPSKSVGLCTLHTFTYLKQSTKCSVVYWFNVLYFLYAAYNCWPLFRFHHLRIVYFFGDLLEVVLVHYQQIDYIEMQEILWHHRPLWIMALEWFHSPELKISKEKMMQSIDSCISCQGIFKHHLKHVECN